MALLVQPNAKQNKIVPEAFMIVHRHLGDVISITSCKSGTQSIVSCTIT